MSQPKPPPTSTSGSTTGSGFAGWSPSATAFSHGAPATEAPRAGAAPAAAPKVARPTPLRRRPWGSLLVGAWMAAATAVCVYWVWDTFIRYEAYGIVQGRTVEVPTPFAGLVQGIAVREGQMVKSGEPLASVENLELASRLERLRDELNVAQSRLSAAVAETTWQFQARGDDRQEAVAEYYAAWGRLLQEQATLADLESQLRRSVELRERKAVSKEAFESLSHREAGQRANVAKLVQAVEELRVRVDLQPLRSDDGWQQLQPEIKQIESLQNELKRVEGQLSRCDLVAPVSGRILKSHYFAGEFAAPEKPLFDLLETDSQELVVFLPQWRADSFRPGDEVTVVVEPDRTEVACRVARCGERYEGVPPSIKRMYRRDGLLWPVWLQPLERDKTTSYLKIGAEVRLPRRWSSLWDWL